MVLQLLSMDLDSRSRRLVVGRELRLLQMARPSGPARPVSTRTAALLVVSSSVSSSLPPAKANANATEPDSDANSAARQADTNS